MNMFGYHSYFVAITIKDEWTFMANPVEQKNL
jgi:hypothetical protein